MSDVYAGPTRPSGAELQEADDRVRSALSSGTEQEFDARLGEYNATWAARFMPDLGLMDIKAELADVDIYPDEWHGEADDREAGE